MTSSTRGDINVISDEQANEIYLRMAVQSQARKGFIKKNWSEEETRLLKWAVITYTRQKNISYNNLVSVLCYHSTTSQYPESNFNKDM